MGPRNVSGRTQVAPSRRVQAQQIADPQEGIGGIDVLVADVETVPEPGNHLLGHLRGDLQTDDAGEAARLELGRHLPHDAPRLLQLVIAVVGHPIDLAFRRRG